MTFLLSLLSHSPPSRKMTENDTKMCTFLTSFWTPFSPAVAQMTPPKKCVIFVSFLVVRTPLWETNSPEVLCKIPPLGRGGKPPSQKTTKSTCFWGPVTCFWTSFDPPSYQRGLRTTLFLGSVFGENDLVFDEKMTKSPP